jgi:hypothetical protein
MDQGDMTMKLNRWMSASGIAGAIAIFSMVGCGSSQDHNKDESCLYETTYDVQSDIGIDASGLSSVDCEIEIRAGDRLAKYLSPATTHTGSNSLPAGTVIGNCSMWSADAATACTAVEGPALDRWGCSRTPTCLLFNAGFTNAAALLDHLGSTLYTYSVRCGGVEVRTGRKDAVHQVCEL